MSNLVPFQWSIKLENGEIYMVQAETAENLGLAIEEITTKFLGKSASKTKAPVVVESESHSCTVHNVPLEKRFSEKKQKFYYGHNIDGSNLVCFGK